MNDPFRTSDRSFDIKPAKTWEDRFENISKVFIPSVALIIAGMLGSWIHGCAARPKDPETCRSSVHMMVSSAQTDRGLRIQNEDVDCTRAAHISMSKDTETNSVFAICQCQDQIELTQSAVASSSVQPLSSTLKEVKTEEVVEDK